MSLTKQTEDNRLLIEALLKRSLPKEEGEQKKIIEAMNYAVTAGGKRIRPQLMLEAYRMFASEEEKDRTKSAEDLPKDLAGFLAAIECIHNYSLIHDDLPAMDNDEYRRGRKTCHVVYGEDMAILAGDGLLNYAYELAADAVYAASDAAATLEERLRIMKRGLEALRVLSKKAGIYGMVGGQCVDVANENNRDMTMDTLLFIHENKTAALIEAALVCGGLLAGAGSEDIGRLEEAGSLIGLAFQIQDDILDETATFEELGKPIGSDKENGKVTYLSLTGPQASRQKVEELTNRAIGRLKESGKENETLKGLLLGLVNRRS